MILRSTLSAMWWVSRCWPTRLPMRGGPLLRRLPGTKSRSNRTRYLRLYSPILKSHGVGSRRLRQKENREIKIAKFPWAASGRAMTLDRTEGMTKLIFDPQTERVLGVGIVGAGAGELIAEGVLAMEMGALAKDVALTIHPHPTLSETVMESAEVFYGTSTDIYRPKR